MKLHYKSLGSGRPLVVLHGLLGSGDNWISVGNVLAENGFQVYLVDQRNHGRSPHHDGMNYDLMASDIQGFIHEHGLEDVVLLGHSMGGKAVMRHAQAYPDVATRLIVVDIAPRFYPPHHQSVFDALKSVDFNSVNSRKAVEEILKSKLNEKSTIDFLMKSLFWVAADRLAWRFNLDALEAAMPHIGAALPSLPVIHVPTSFFRGERSNYIRREDESAIGAQFIHSSLTTIPGAGHWVHADQPKAFIEAVLQFLVK